MSPAEQLQHAATLLQMSPNARRRAQSEIIRVPSSRGGSRRNNNAELPAWYDPIELAKMQQRMLEEDDEDDLPSSITGRIGAYTLQERRKKLERYLEKRTRRIWDRNVRYQCRKNIAVNRLRVRGRFISREEELSLINAGFSPAIKDAEKTAKETFQKGGFGSELPEIKIKLKEIKDGLNFLDFIANNKILPSKSEVRRAIDNKGFKIDDVVLSDKNKILQLNDFKKNVLKISYGKKKHFLVKIT